MQELFELVNGHLSGIGVVDDRFVLDERMIPQVENRGCFRMFLARRYIDANSFLCIGVNLRDNDPEVFGLFFRFGQKESVTTLEGQFVVTGQRDRRIASSEARPASSVSIASISSGLLCCALRISAYAIGIALPCGSCHSGSLCTTFTMSHRLS